MNEDTLVRQTGEDNQEYLRRVLKRAVERDSAPESLRQKIRAMIGKQKQKSPR